MAWDRGWIAVRGLALGGAVASLACARPNPAFEAETDAVGSETGSVLDDAGPATSIGDDDGAVDGDAGEGTASADDGAVGECGDGTVDPDEECDDGELNANEGHCQTDCTKNLCGDGKPGPGQPCDDGNNVSGDGCTDCMLDSCGNGLVEKGEDCDPQDPESGPECTPFCTIPVCGDEFTSPGEDCDDGNGDDSDECTNACTLPFCGDGITTVTDQIVEECDDANDNDNDECVGCQHATCGDGFIQEGVEACEPGISPMFSCGNAKDINGSFACSETECTWGSVVDGCCVQIGGPCVVSEMCCGEMLCVDEQCTDG